MVGNEVRKTEFLVLEKWDSKEKGTDKRAQRGFGEKMHTPILAMGKREHQGGHCFPYLGGGGPELPYNKNLR